MDALALIEKAEDFREFAYDDATDEYLKPGYTLKGHVTVGFGFNLESGSGGGLSRAESETILRGRIAAISLKLREIHSTFSSFNQPRRDALISAAYNLGVYGLLGFRAAWVCLNTGDFKGAGGEFRDSNWWRNPATHNRAEQTAKIIETGEYA